MAENTYLKKTVLVTGHTGFVGSWLTLWLNHLGANVIGYSIKPINSPNLFDALNLQNKIIHVEGDITQYNEFAGVFRDYNPEFVFHLAAQPIVRQSYKVPRLFYETNVMGTVNVLECLRHSNSVKTAVIFTSDKCYENIGVKRGYLETDRLGGRDPYSSSKACAELVTRAYRDSFDMPCSVSTVRAGNIVGGGDWSVDRLIPDFIRALQDNNLITLRYPSAFRPWQYVLDAISGLLTLGSAMDKFGKSYNGAWNFSMDSSCTSVETLVQLLIKYWGSGSYVVDASPQPHEDIMLNLDSSKSHNVLGWYPQLTVEEMIERAVYWYKRFYDGINDMYSVSIDEIEKYEVLNRG